MIDNYSPVHRERLALHELGELRFLLTRLAGSSPTWDSLTRAERDTFGAALTSADAAHDRVHRRYLIDDPA